MSDILLKSISIVQIQVSLDISYYYYFIFNINTLSVFNQILIKHASISANLSAKV